ncbi:MAG: S41 family peptidase [Erythrobacter sp.]
MRFLRLMLKLAAGLVVSALLAIGVDIATFDRAAAEADYERLKHALAQNYANLDWQRDHRGLDLTALDHETGEALGGAYGRMGAYLVFRDFIGSFRDPHLHIDWGAAPDWTHVVERSQVGDGDGATCEAMGYEAEDMRGDIGFEALEGWQAIASPNFPAGVIGDTGALRIAEFGENKYGGVCERAQQPGQDQRALQLATRAILQDELRAAIAAIRAAGATRLIVDVTGNGGGSEWASEAAALFADGTLWRARPQMPDPQCDRSGIWEGEEVCPIFTGEPESEEIEGEGSWTGPLTILVDRNSASATEAFATWLAGSGRAQLVGERTLGAGCGFIDGGNAVELESVPIHVMMPNCSRFTLDGINEIEGLEPDIVFDLAADGAARRLIALLEGA